MTDLRHLAETRGDEISARFDDYGYTADLDTLAIVSDSIDAFLAARKLWNKPGRIETNGDGVLEIVDCQPMPGQPKRSVCIIDFGAFRAVYGATN